MKPQAPRPEIERCCARCEHATILAQCDYILCAKKGVVSDTHVCRRFIYDPLKRDPRRMPPLPHGDEAEAVEAAE